MYKWLKLCRFGAILLVILFGLVGCGGTILSSHSTDVESDDVSEEKNVFEIVGDTLVKYNGSEEKVVIPKGVKHIGKEVFFFSKITEAVLPDGLISINEAAFAHCEKLTKVNFPDGLLQIEERAFWDSGIVGDLVFPDSLEVLGDYAFRDCKAVSTISVPRTIQKVGVDVFEGTLWTEPSCELDPDVSPLEVYPVCNGIYFHSALNDAAIIPYGVEKLCDIRQPELDRLLLPPTIRDLEHFNFNDGEIKIIYGIAGSETEALAERYGLIFEPLALEQTSLTLRVGENYELVLNSGSHPYWESKDETIILTHAYRFYGGTFTALAPGKTTISAEIYGETFTCEVIVIE